MSDSVTLERTFTQSDFDAFAELSGDRNPIHIDPGFSARTRFGRTVAHGLLLLSVVRELASRLSPGSRMVEQDAVFPAPTYAGEPMEFHCEFTDQDPGSPEKGGRIRFSVTRIDDDVTTCQGTARLETS